jgi:pimeloyl-ACP methyl ester carboxylesterase
LRDGLEGSARRENPRHIAALEAVADRSRYGPIVCHDEAVAQLYRSVACESEVRRWCADRLHAWQVPHSTDVVNSSLGETHLTWAGEGTDTCVFLPGTNFNAATSTGLLEALSYRCRVVCADLPGQPGLSAAHRPGDETQQYSRWVAEVIEEVRRHVPGGRVVLMGHSRGAAVALAASPDSVDSLVLLSPAGLAPVHLTPGVLVSSVLWLIRPTPRSAGRLVQRMASEDGTDLDLIVEWMALVGRSTRTTGAPGPLPREVLVRWRGRPMRILVGAEDIFFPPPRLEGPARRFLGERVEVLQDAGHLLVDERPDAVATALTDALGELNAR